MARQGEGITFSVEDKIRIARRLDEFGMDFIEGGWPGSNPKDEEFFARHARRAPQARAASRVRKHAPRRHRGKRIPSFNPLAAETPVVTIFGKSWEEHVTFCAGTTLEENLAHDRRE